MKSPSWFIFLMIPTSVSHVCKIFQNFPLRLKLSVYEIEFLLLKMWARHRFSALFPLRGSGFAVYICLVGGVVIFDELWAFTGIDIWVNTVLGPVYGDTEVNPDAILTYSEHMFADIHGNDSGATYEVRLLYSCLLSSEKGCFCTSLSKDNTLGLCENWYEILYSLDILNWWVFQRRRTVGITIYVRTCFSPDK